MKDHKAIEKKSKRKSLVLTENTAGVDEEWRPMDASPLMPVVNISNRTSFHFVPFLEGHDA